MPICITGMHRSGTSMVAKLLHQCGIYLGPESDLMPPMPENPDGFWENVQFFGLNEDILEELGEGWDFVQVPALPDKDARLERIKGKAEMLLRGFADREPWAWKDPRNCLTLPFWMSFLPGLKVIHCIRNPLEVALSLRRRNVFSFNHSLVLWKIYNQRALDAVPPEQLLVTHYDSFFERPQREIRRVLDFLKLPASEGIIKGSLSAISRSLRHCVFTSDHLLLTDAAPDIVELYTRLCILAGRPQANPLSGNGSEQTAAEQDHGGRERQQMRQVDRSAVELELLRREVQGLRPKMAAQKETIQTLEGKLAEQNRTLAEAAARASEQEAALGRLQDALKQHEALRSDIADLRQALQQEVQQLREEIRPRQEKVQAERGPVDDLVPATSPTPTPEAPTGAVEEYQFLLERIREIVRVVLPQGARVLVISKGDDDLLKLDGRRALHFPQTEEGVYAGHHPADSAEAIADLETARTRGAEFLLVPEPAAWWLEHYRDFREHLLGRYRTMVQCDGVCRIFDLCRPPEHPSPPAESQPGHGTVAAPAASANGVSSQLTSQVGGSSALTHANIPVELFIAGEHRRKVLVVGIYSTDVANNMDRIVRELARSRRYTVVQRWIAEGKSAPAAELAGVTARRIPSKAPKYVLLNDLLTENPWQGFDFIITMDDDIDLPAGFVDGYIALQSELEFMIAQPARTLNSFCDYPIVLQQPGIVGRQTRFVEAGPLASFHKTVFPFLLPFDLTSPMGWGYENVWSHQLAERNLKMGIIDAFAMEHTMRPRGVSYDCRVAESGRKALLDKMPHLKLDDCFRVVQVIGREESREWAPNG